MRMCMCVCVCPHVVGVQVADAGSGDVVDAKADWTSEKARLTSAVAAKRAEAPTGVSVDVGMALVALGNAARLHNELAEAER